VLSVGKLVGKSAPVTREATDNGGARPPDCLSPQSGPRGNGCRFAAS
jgi:hypothetical protein